VDHDDGWAKRLRQARLAKFSTTWQAARALSWMDPKLPDMKTLHRYWSQRWEGGLIRPSRTYRELIEQLLECPGLFRSTGTAARPAPARPPEPPVRAAAGSVTGPAGVPDRRDQPDRPDRPGRHAGTVRPHSVAGRANVPCVDVAGEVRMAADEVADHAAASDAGVGERTVEQLHDDVVRLARGYATRTLVEVFRDARETRNLAARLAERTRRPAQLADLYALAGKAAGVLANAAFDMGYWDAAARFAGSALTYGDLAGSDSLRAWALGMQGFVAHWQGRPEDTLRKVGEALTFAPAGTATVRLRAIEARARGQLSDRDGVASAIRAGEEARESDNRDDLHDGVGGELGYEPARLYLGAASAYVKAGDGSAAEQHARHALDLYAATPSSEWAYYAEHCVRVSLAAGRVLRGDLAGAREALAAVFALPPEQRSAGILGRLDEVRALLAADILRDSREARQLRDDITDFVAGTPTQPLPDET
jgi:tetratricopeptide (TPR) repeat protein